MTTNPNTENDSPAGNPVPAPHPRNAEELHRWAWNENAPGILAAMNVPAGTDPGPVPAELLSTAQIEWPEDDEDEDYYERAAIPKLSREFLHDFMNTAHAEASAASRAAGEVPPVNPFTIDDPYEVTDEHPDELTAWRIEMSLLAMERTERRQASLRYRQVGSVTK